MFIAIATGSLDLGTNFNFFAVGTLRFISGRFTFYLNPYPANVENMVSS